MSAEEPSQPSGPVMLVATNMLRPPPTRIGKIGDNFTLPRTIPLVNALAGGAGLLVGLAVSVPFAGIGGIRVIMLGAVLGLLAGLAVVTFSPLKGESLARWLGLSAQRFGTQKVEIDGRPARVYVGVAPLKATALGRVRIASGAADVMVGTVDERGVLIPHEKLVRARDIASGDYIPGSDWSPDATPLPKASSLRLDDKPSKASRRKTEKDSPSRGEELPAARSRAREKLSSVKAPSLPSPGRSTKDTSTAPKKLKSSATKPLTPPKR